ncbi:Mis12-domain-containing protein [Suhomyces tanzawaensis NRRL Y-17324]|uniref:Mis12-domain-containing protein n=1 Tax=Suhomyces tanzawaensis NRRL Y-17324 TaxID=984487 RepID=A0A1E4SSC9_9ASCO|nr:Mis12-domain-containing protein [Suhomyces tanzawaensis NRRL Y-17324]ODV82405.1 Mis12-domain-containing protein [Suhomyces tanzawaensis NRRL Y-17324]
MASIDHRVTSLLTEHLGFPPLALIDDIINAVNELLYKCTQAMETYLLEVRDKRLKQSDSSSVVSKEEIQLGTGKLETLLESQVDKNFDKFELYSLRNIFTIPQELVEEGWIKLKHHEGINYNPSTSKASLDDRIALVVRSIKLELQLRKMLKLQIMKAKKIIKALRLFQRNLRFLSQGERDGEAQMSPKAREALKSLSPIDETLYFLLSQVEELTAQTRSLYKKLGGKEDNIKGFLPDVRDRYIDGRVGGIVQRLGEDAPDSVPMESLDSRFLGDFSSISDIDLVKDIGAALNDSLPTAESPQREPQEEAIEVEQPDIEVEEAESEEENEGIEEDQPEIEESQPEIEESQENVDLPDHNSHEQQAKKGLHETESTA